jgi:hypothetical protein
LGYQIKEDEMGGACGMYRGGRKCCAGLWWGNPKEIDHLENYIEMGE